MYIGPRIAYILRLGFSRFIGRVTVSDHCLSAHCSSNSDTHQPVRAIIPKTAKVD